jgi:hypothetical protein
MATKKSQKRAFNGMRYRELQRANSVQRTKIQKEHKKWLKDNGYRNVGWDNVISLAQKLNEILDESRFDDMSLEELFLEADRIGNKYLTAEEIQEFNQKLSQEVSEIGELIDEQFPDTEVEVIDFGSDLIKEPQNKRDRKTYRTVKI